MKLGVALLLARLAWRFVRAHAAARAGRRVLAAVGADAAPLPRLRLDLSPRLWLLAFLATSTLLPRPDRRRAGRLGGRWPLLAPWLHTSALPVFAVLAVLVALAWSAVARWLADYERYAEETVRPRRPARHGASQPPRVAHAPTTAAPPRESSSASPSRAARRPLPA